MKTKDCTLPGTAGPRLTSPPGRRFTPPQGQAQPLNAPEFQI